MNKFRRIGYGAVSLMSLAPALVSAQIDARLGGTGLPQGSILDIMTSLMNWLLIVVGILGVIGFIIAGILYLTAAGDEGQIGKAKTAMIYSIVGVVVALLGLIIIRAVQALLGGNSTSF
ncbi:MAG: hypothetical protein UY41_C0045G0006 [Candidatus Moranbacteria bacterium GW2011_GWE1_49_15]|nr:MAG: hypothetical protein UX75_C0049G0006 [Candidatus Moranbacteria bacterium GW2011_GWE2_47_10]KKW05620.1 MAG: hypothetical protein UY41_C0045G0006 [Candidatus Moranbacteria bacterium GW2011_GWE1_49_15]HBP00722.1 hypothetical protein [Candidatus Moranbacteria bacterium]